MQSLEDFVDGIENIAEAQARGARAFLEDGSVEAAVPPLKALLHIMAEGQFEGRTLADPEVRRLFTREAVLSSDWYRARLVRYRDREAAHVRRCLDALRDYRELARVRDPGAVEGARLRSEEAEARLAKVMSEGFVDTLVGFLGLDPLFEG
jgi:hypothetical protein